MSPNVALCVEAGFCQMQSHIVINDLLNNFLISFVIPAQLKTKSSR